MEEIENKTKTCQYVKRMRCACIESETEKQHLSKVKEKQTKNGISIESDEMNRQTKRKKHSD